MVKDNQVAVITGAASGIGLALSQACLRRKMHVVMADISHDNLMRAANSLHHSDSDILPVVCDVTQLSDVEALAEQSMQRFKRVDLLINNAGISGELVPVWELSLEQVHRVVDVNLFGTIHGIKVFLPLLFDQEHRSTVVNMASVYGLVSGSQVASYSISKHAVVALSESLFFDLRRLNKLVDVAVICPSFANTSLLSNSQSENPGPFQQMMAALLERSRPPAEVAEHILSELEKKTFYILPDKEVKQYCEQRINAIIAQHDPAQHSLESIMAALSERRLRNP